MYATNFKPAKGTAKAERRQRTNWRQRRERIAMAIVRVRDPRCRFPLCGCEQFRYVLHVCHLVHRGMGGDPSGERTTTGGLVRLCAPRHLMHRLSVDRHTIRWEGLTDRGADGPIRWLIETEALWDAVRPVPDQVGEIELAREAEPYHLEPLTPWQESVLSELATMDL